MNILAHVYLAGDDPHLVIGNFIADHVKGKVIESLDPIVQKGVLMHRKIDFFTDHHPETLKTKKRLQPQFHKYAPVISDMFYDHFLASQWKSYSPVPLEQYAADFYSLVTKNLHLLPEKSQSMVPHLVRHNWIMAYATVEGLDSILSSMARRASFESGMENAAEALQKDYESYRKEFDVFFPELKMFADTLLEEIKNG